MEPSATSGRDPEAGGLGQPPEARPAPGSLAADEVAEFLARMFDPAVAGVEPIPGGAWSQAFTFVAAGRPLVVRFSAVEDDFLNDRRAARLASRDLPIPLVRQIGRAFDGWYAISDRHEGDYLEEADEATMRARLPAVFAMLDAIRAADVSTTRGFGRWGPDGHGAYATWPHALVDVGGDHPGLRTHGWRDRLAERPDAAVTFERAHRELRAMADDLPDARHLVHADLLNRNVLAVGPSITAVLDWGAALYGDFLFDVAWFAFWGPWYERWSAADVAGEVVRHLREIGLDVPDLARRLRACELYIGLDGLAYQAWAGFDAPLAWTTRRLQDVLRAD